MQLFRLWTIGKQSCPAPSKVAICIIMVFFQKKSNLFHILASYITTELFPSDNRDSFIHLLPINSLGFVRKHPIKVYWVGRVFIWFIMWNVYAGKATLTILTHPAESNKVFEFRFIKQSWLDNFFRMTGLGG